MSMDIDYDQNKNQSNINKHNIDFEQAHYFDWDSSITEVDSRQDYGETRLNTLGFLNGRLHLMTFTIRGNVIRVISLRKANKREIKHYESQ